MNKDDKKSVLLAAKKLKRTNHKPEDMEQSQAGSKSFRDNGNGEDISDRIINAVSNLKKD